jgi:Domain of unknown function (DUF4419)
MGRTFAVSKVELAKQPKPALDRTAALAKVLGKTRVEQVYESKARLVICTNRHPFVQMAHDAFYEHRPIAISPDAVWFCIAQGFAHHVNANAEALRHHFVQHEGKVELVVTRKDFELGKRNPWPKVFAAFSEQIAAHVGKRRDLVVADFSTTGPLERAATEVVLMDTFQAYFAYAVMMGAGAGPRVIVAHGIPAITLLGKPKDWRSIRRRAQILSEFGLEAWIDTLLPVLDRIVAAAEGEDDPAFWQSFFQHRRSLKGSAMSGWITVLFPYLERGLSKDLVPNPNMASWKELVGSDDAGLGVESIPSELASAPVELFDVRTRETVETRFVAGMFGVVETRGVLAPEFGWAVVYA